jgi:hypothetical protein
MLSLLYLLFYIFNDDFKETIDGIGISIFLVLLFMLIFDFCNIIIGATFF